MWQFEATFCSLFCSDWFRRRHQLWCYSCGSDRNAACLFIYLKDRRQRQERHLKASLYLFLPTFFQGSVKGAGMSYLGVDELEKSADICSPLSLLLPGRVRSGWADFVVFSQSLTRIFCFTSSQIWCQIAASVLTRRRLCRPPRPRLLQRNNGGKNSTLKPLLYSLWCHRMRCPRGRWEMKCLQWLLCFLLDIEQPLKLGYNTQHTALWLGMISVSLYVFCTFVA